MEVPEFHRIEKPAYLASILEGRVFAANPATLPLTGSL
jgi:hypothetical protein